jgi:hypothetical protein
MRNRGLSQQSAEAFQRRGRISKRRAEQSDCITSRLPELDMHSQECERMRNRLSATARAGEEVLPNHGNRGEDALQL